MPDHSSPEPSESRQIIQLAWPTIITFSVLSIRAVYDVWLVGRLEQADLAALGPAQLILALFLGFGYGSLYAVNTFVSQAVGGRRLSECGRFAWQGIWFSCAFGCLALLLWIFSPALFAQFGHEPAVYERELRFFRTTVFSIVPQLVAFAITNFFFGIGRPGIPLLLGLFSTAIHAISGYVLTFSDSLPTYRQIEGAAWGLVIGSTAYALSMIAWLLLDRRLSPYGTREIRPRWGRLKKIMAIGIPVGGRDFVDTAVWSVALIWLIGQFGTAHLAAATVLLACIDILILPCDGFGAALVTLIGQATGKREFNQAKSRCHQAWLIMSLYAASVGIAFYLLRTPILEFIATDPETGQLAIQLSPFVPILLFLYSLNSVYDHALCGAGDNTWPTVVNLGSSVAILGIGGWVVLRFFPASQSFGVWTLLSINLSVIVLALWLRWKGNSWQRISLFEDAESLVKD